MAVFGAFGVFGQEVRNDRDTGLFISLLWLAIAGIYATAVMAIEVQDAMSIALLTSLSDSARRHCWIYVFQQGLCR
jgi:hypothetical protein